MKRNGGDTEVTNTMDSQAIRRPWVLGLTGIAFFMVGLDALVVNNALPTIHRELGGSLSDLEWIFNAYLIAFAVGIIPAAAGAAARPPAARSARPGRPTSATRPLTGRLYSEPLSTHLFISLLLIF